MMTTCMKNNEPALKFRVKLQKVEDCLSIYIQTFTEIPKKHVPFS